MYQESAISFLMIIYFLLTLIKANYDNEVEVGEITNDQVNLDADDDLKKMFPTLYEILTTDESKYILETQNMRKLNKKNMFLNKTSEKKVLNPKDSNSSIFICSNSRDPSKLNKENSNDNEIKNSEPTVTSFAETDIVKINKPKKNSHEVRKKLKRKITAKEIKIIPEKKKKVNESKFLKSSNLSKISKEKSKLKTKSNFRAKKKQSKLNVSKIKLSSLNSSKSKKNTTNSAITTISDINSLDNIFFESVETESETFPRITPDKITKQLSDKIPLESEQNTDINNRIKISFLSFNDDSIMIISSDSDENTSINFRGKIINEFDTSTSSDNLGDYISDLGKFSGDFSFLNSFLDDDFSSFSTENEFTNLFDINYND